MENQLDELLCQSFADDNSHLDTTQQSQPEVSTATEDFPVEPIEPLLDAPDVSEPTIVSEPKRVKRKQSWHFKKRLNKLYVTMLLLFVCAVSIFLFLLKNETRYNISFNVFGMIIISALIAALCLIICFIIYKRLSKREESATEEKRTTIGFLRDVFMEIAVGAIFIAILGFFANALLSVMISRDYTLYCVGFTFEGRMDKANANGAGRIIRWDGDEYSGEFRNGRYEGHGTYRFNNGWLSGAVYEGNFVFGKMHGPGKITFPNQDTEDKTKANDERTISDGRVYEGTFSRGEITGKGKLVFSKTNRIYTGAVKDGKMDGIGKLEIGNGCWYEGDFKDDRKDGDGIMHFPSGSKYEAVWEYGEVSFGDIKYTDENGGVRMRFMAPFMEMVGMDMTGQEIKIIDPNEPRKEPDAFDIYDHMHHDIDDVLIAGSGLENYKNRDRMLYIYRALDVDCLNGYNKIQFYGDGDYGMGGHQYEGYFLDGTMHGYGVMLYRDAGTEFATYAGSWEDGYMHGVGVFYNIADKVRIEANFVNGDPLGESQIVYDDGTVKNVYWVEDWAYYEID